MHTDGLDDTWNTNAFSFQAKNWHDRLRTRHWRYRCVGDSVMAGGRVCGRVGFCVNFPAGKREKCASSTGNTKRVYKDASPIHYVPVCLQWWVQFSPRAGRTSTTSFYLVTQLEKTRGFSPSFINSFPSDVIKDLGEWCCTRTLNTAQSRDQRVAA
jgi:hypothetical protein